MSARREPLRDLNRFKAEFAQYVESFVASTISDSLTTHQRQAISLCWDDYLASVAANGGIVLPSKISVECDEIVLKKIQYLLRHLFHFRITISDAENSPSKNTIISTTMHRRFPLDWSSVLVSCLSYLQINIILYIVLKPFGEYFSIFLSSKAFNIELLIVLIVIEMYVPIASYDIIDGCLEFLRSYLVNNEHKLTPSQQDYAATENSPLQGHNNAFPKFPSFNSNQNNDFGARIYPNAASFTPSEISYKSPPISPPRSQKSPQILRIINSGIEEYENDENIDKKTLLSHRNLDSGTTLAFFSPNSYNVKSGDMKGKKLNVLTDLANNIYTSITGSGSGSGKVYPEKYLESPTLSDSKIHDRTTDVDEGSEYSSEFKLNRSSYSLSPSRNIYHPKTDVNLHNFAAHLKHSSKVLVMNNYGSSSDRAWNRTKPITSEKNLSILLKSFNSHHLRFAVALWSDETKWLTPGNQKKPSWLSTDSDVSSIMNRLKAIRPDGGNDLRECLNEALRDLPDCTDVVIFCDDSVIPFSPIKIQPQMFAVNNWVAFRNRFPKKNFHFIATNNNADKNEMRTMAREGQGYFFVLNNK